MSDHTWYIKPKYSTVKDDINAFFARTNEESDMKNWLLMYHSSVICSFPENTRKVLNLCLMRYIAKSNVNINTNEFQPITGNTTCDDLWIDNQPKLESKYDDDLLVLSENESSKLLTEIIRILKHHNKTTTNSDEKSPTYRTQLVLHNLLTFKYEEFNSMIRRDLKSFVDNVNLNDEDEYKKLIAYYYSPDTIYEENKHNQFTAMLDKVVEYSYQELNKKDRKDVQPSYRCPTRDELERRKQVVVRLIGKKNISIFDCFYEMLKLTKEQFYYQELQEKTKDTFVGLYVKKWAFSNKDAFRSGTYWTFDDDEDAFDNKDYRIMLLNLFEKQYHDKLSSKEIKQQFIHIATSLIMTEFNLNRQRFCAKLQHDRSVIYIEKAQMKIKMNSIKQLRACWYQGINVKHNILPNDPIREDHVLAAIAYTDCTEFCTAFRQTYRHMDDQKLKHSLYANVGKALYEAFVFFGTADNVQRLYHGMNMRLVFKTLYCVFDAPTSTTSEQSVASNFGSDGGIVVQFSGCDSTKFIKTLNMELFSQYDNEHEHLIFETRLRIDDIFLPSPVRSAWIGQDWIHVLSLYDLLIHGSIIHDQKLLKKRTQKLLVKTLKNVLEEKTLQITQSVYLNELIASLTEGNKNIWLNMSQVERLNENAKRMFVSDDHQFGEFILYLKRKHNIIVYPVFTVHWKLSESFFDLVSKKSGGKYNNIEVKMAGPIITCNLSNNKQILFQPEITDADTFLAIQMKLLSTYNNLHIKVHFDIESLESDVIKYYRPSHPRLMNTKHANVFNFSIPSINVNEQETSNKFCNLSCQNTSNNATETDVSVNISIMFHNFDDFGVRLKNVNTENMMRTAHVFKAARTNTIAEIMSIL
eukprot:524568_1